MDLVLMVLLDQEEMEEVVLLFQEMLMDKQEQLILVVEVEQVDFLHQ